jgi:hypothetical protein
MADPTKPSRETRAAEREDMDAKHEADRQPTPDEEKIADSLEVDPEAAAGYEEMAKRGANQKGEGRI